MFLASDRNSGLLRSVNIREAGNNWSKMCDGVEVISVEMFDIITVIERVPPKDSQCHDNLSSQVCDKIQFDNLVMIVC